MVEIPADRTSDIPSSRTAPLTGLLLLLVTATVALIGWLYLTSNSRADRLDGKADTLAAAVDARAEVIDELSAGQQAMREQLIALGVKPAVPAPSETVREIIREGAIGPAGESGATGPRGEQGIAGRDGRDGTTPACWFEEAQCQGADGADGVDGQDGATGATGADSTVPGPQGEPGATGPPGPATECEAGYHWTTVAIQGDDYRVCTAD